MACIMNKGIFRIFQKLAFFIVTTSCFELRFTQSMREIKLVCALYQVFRRGKNDYHTFIEKILGACSLLLINKTERIRTSLQLPKMKLTPILGF